MENAKQIYFFPNYYIHKDGRIYSKTSNKFLKINDYHGFRTIKLYNNGLSKTWRISDLIKIHFNSDEKMKVCYSDSGEQITDTQHITVRARPFVTYTSVIDKFNEVCRIND